MLNKFNLRGSKKENDASHLFDSTQIPSHIAIIMDGNGRWAKKRGLPRIAGHKEGMDVVKKMVRESDRLGVQVLTLYAFSTENWKRPKTEVDFLMKLPEQFLTSYLEELIENNVRVEVMGDAQQLPRGTVKAIETAISRTSENDGMILNFALNYGSRHELTDAVKQIISDVQADQLTVNDIDESIISSYLLTKQYPDPDLLIRTSGEIRLSNFLLWQLAYTELWFTDVLWPDFTEEHLGEAIAHFARRHRRFGSVNN
ncbi:isoprenyl transferase [Tuberibacillus sp. Marseille-P3662]|uniref:isoprenyl transferase n=1 Tax=Tuberibacillus sp. Marseille-P3662 TaxID=1965358 RepID=UPI000A1CA6E3|nr:isoprenyl transferase [Tuberibacillus sp. Marseille-P3662]